MAVIRPATAGPGGHVAAQEARIALIATGPDAAEERDLVNRFCLPEVRRHCRGRNIDFNESLLVSGAETARDLTAGHVASVLDTIRRDRPIVICLIGRERGTAVPPRVLRSRGLLNRHPWLEHLADEGLSLAEIAMLEGVLGNPVMKGRVIATSRGALRSSSRRSADPMVRLAERLRASDVSILSGYDDRRALADRICQETIALVDRLLPDAPPPSHAEHLRRAQEAFAASRRQAYVEVSSYGRRLDAHVAGDDRPLIISGETGSGKSALVANWIEHYRMRAPSAFVIVHYAGATGPDSDHIALLRQIMVEISERYSLTDEVPSTSREIVEAIPLWLARVQRERLVLVLDGLNQLAPQSQQLEWLPRHIPPQVRLVVSAADGAVLDRLRERRWSELRLKPLTLNERRSVTREFLGERSRRLTGEQLRRVTNESTSANPLFLRIRLEELRAHGPAGRLNDRIDGFLDAGDLDKLFDRVLDRIERSHGEAIVAEVMTLLWASRRGLSSADLEALSDAGAEKLADLLSALDFHLISRDGLLTFFHDCMRQAVAARYDLDRDARARRAHRKLAKFFAGLPISRRRATEEPWQHLRGSDRRKLRECIGSIDMFMELSADESEYELLGYWMTLGSIEEMASVYATNLEQYEAGPSRSHPIALVLDRLGRFLHHAGLFDRAEPFLQRAVARAQEELGSGDPRAMEISKHLVLLLLERGKYDEGIERCRALIDALGPRHGDTHPMIIDALTLLADGQLYLDQLDEAEQSARRAVSACERVYGPEDPRLAEALFNLSAILRSRGEYTIAESLLRRVLAIDEKVYGSAHPTTALTRGDLGALLSRTGRLAEAETILRDALAVRERVLGPDHAHTGQSYNQLGSFYKNLERYDEASGYYRSAIRVFERTLGARHPHLGAAMANLSGSLRYADDLEEAERLGRQALSMIEESLGSEHSTTMLIRGNLGRTLLMAGKREEAEENLRRALEWCRATLGPLHKSTAFVLGTLAELLAGIGEADEAADLARQAIEAYRATLGNDHRDVARMHVILARAEAARGDFEECRRQSAIALEIVERLGIPEHALAQEARRLLLIATSAGNDDAAIDAASSVMLS